ncbi:MAG TPA: MGMT family protein [Gammaproteobacteria bacterium]|nr:MGMT family protein [Gammaproteobacteria bacterium]
MAPVRGTDSSQSVYQRIYAEVRRIPRGRVSTYGGIARRLGACTARQVGYAMAALPEGSRIPWHRVINHKGEISLREGAERQRTRLEREGIHFNLRGRVDLSRVGWPA